MMKPESCTRNRKLRRGIPASLTACVFLLLVVLSNASNLHMTYLPAMTSASDAPVDWTPEVLPSTLSYTLSKNASSLIAGEDLTISTALPITQTSIAFDNITVEPILVPVEMYIENVGMSTSSFNMMYFQSLKVPSSCYVRWVSLFIQTFVNSSNPMNFWNVSIYNATGAFPDSSPTPDKQIPLSSTLIDPRMEEASGTEILGHWENVTLGDVFLNTSRTLFHGGYYHFFVAAMMPRLNNHLWWLSTDTGGLGQDYGKAFVWQGIQLSTLPYVPLNSSEAFGVDFTCITKLYPVSTNPRPTDIKLSVNDEAIMDTGAGQGIYASADTIMPSNDIVTYEVSSAWGDYPGGSFKCDTSINYTVRDSIVPLVQASIYPGNSSVAWRATYDFSAASIRGQRDASLSVGVPLSWMDFALYNSTGPVPVSFTGSSFTVISPTGKYRTFSASGITPGSWLFRARSAIIVPVGGLTIDSGTIGLGGTVAGTLSVVNGPNGRVVALRSDYEGGVSSISVIGGHANTTGKNAIVGLDGRAIRFSNATSTVLEHIYQKFLVDEYVGNYAINATADLWVDLPASTFRTSDIQDLEIVMDHRSFDESWWYGNLTAAMMNGAALNTTEAFDLLLEDDLEVVELYFTYNNSPGAKHYSDVYLNYSLNVFDAIAVQRDAITSLTFDVVSNFSAPDNHQVIYLRNQSSTAKEWVQMTELAERPALLWFLHGHWESDNDPAVRNITQFISAIGNTVEVLVRTYNDTNVNTALPGHNIFVDQAVMNFTYVNTFKSIDLQVYNWTSAEYMPGIINLAPVQTMGRSVVSLGDEFGNNFSGLLDPATGKVRLKIGAEALTPIVNPVWFDLDRLMVNLTYSSYVRCTWNQTVFNADGGQSFQSVQETLYDSPSNNLSVSIPVLSLLDYYDDYNYTMTWTNGTDVMHHRVGFRIDRFQTTLVQTRGIDVDYARAGSVLQIQLQLTYQGNGSGVGGQLLTVHVYADPGGTETFTGLTNAQGIASIAIDCEDSWDSFQYDVVYSPSDPRFKPSAISTSTSVPVYNDTEFVGYLLRTYWYIYAPALAVILLAAVIKRTGDAKKQRFWKADANKIRDVVKIQHLMVIMKSSGACIVNRSYSQMQLDGDLISGFLHAIATFGKEVGGGDRGAPKKTSGDAIVFDYQDFKILLQEGAQVRLALILNGPPTEGLKDRARQFIAAFEGSHDMQKWRGNLDVFTDVDNYIEQAFEITLIYPLVVNPKKSKKDIKSGLGRALYEVGEAVQKEKQAFYLATLLNYAQAGRKESQDQVLGEIYRLKAQGFLTFYNPQAVPST